MIAEADVSGDGRVDYSEFAHLWKTSLLQRHHKPATGRLQQVCFPAGALPLLFNAVGSCCRFGRIVVPVRHYSRHA